MADIGNNIRDNIWDNIGNNIVAGNLTQKVFWITRDKIKNGLYCMWSGGKPVLENGVYFYTKECCQMNAWNDEIWPFDWKLKRGRIIEVEIIPKET